MARQYKATQFGCEDSTHGTFNGGWPGNTNAELKRLGVVLKVKNNTKGVTTQDFCGFPSDMDKDRLKQILCTFGEGWVELTGPLAPQSGKVGGVLEDEDGCTPQSNNASRSRTARGSRTAGGFRTARRAQTNSNRTHMKKAKNSSAQQHYSKNPTRRKQIIINDTDDKDKEIPVQTSQKAKKKQRVLPPEDNQEDSSMGGSPHEDLHSDGDNSSNSSQLPDF
ncbi:uncharacterized protein PGTG_06697 [Puccinia graminis f. sp. tritici CRL 75-36-700-3]|uniref:Uncharacterized protein n=1 Tax=Puccinia graminis f. sp. tritici (strain CRL 75-36-700-3 / race SCCL) TaxID=418459 RepID=E3K8D1_PUCGT|nr:uncharacterized protein PGTG_06697 [Puccinia graminis f. sp. tritici CRL 75-36-700-3]EFP80741.2 hypothetical protein PGTG_06697 [Puccinia graminis f. sp. tritici CRL 75-36-700-3]